MLGDILLFDTIPAAFLTSLDTNSQKTKAALIVLNMTLSPVERSAFRDNESKYKSLHTKFRKNRCTLLYIDTGVPLFHTIYQKPAEPVSFQAGDIYFAEIIAQTTWPPLFPARKIDSAGKKIEYGPALFNHITVSKAINCLDQFKNKRVLINR